MRGAATLIGATAALLGCTPGWLRSGQGSGATPAETEARAAAVDAGAVAEAGSGRGCAASGNCTEAKPSTPIQSKYLDAVKAFGDRVLSHGRDLYGPTKTPLFVDGLDVVNFKPYVWKNNLTSDQSSYPADQISANFGMNIQLLTTLDELSRISGDQRYATAAAAAARYGLKHLVHANGNILWGHHATYDALNDVVVGLKQPVPMFEAKTMVPNFAYLARFDTTVVERHLLQTLNAGITSWDKLEFTRHMSYSRKYSNPLAKVSQIIPDLKVPFETKRGMSYTGYAVPLIHGAIEHFLLTGDQRAFDIGYYLLKRFMDARDPATGLGSMGYAYIPGTDGADPKHFTRAYGTNTNRYHWTGGLLVKKASLLQPSSAERAKLLDFIELELVPYVKAVLSRPTPSAPHQMVWVMATAYRLTKKKLYWDYLRGAMKRLRLGDVGDEAGTGFAPVAGRFDANAYPGRSSSDIRLKHRHPNFSGFVIHALVEMYRATGRAELLGVAESVADEILDNLFDNGLFVREKEMRYSRLASLTPLALLDLVAAKNGMELDPQSVFPRNLYLRIRHQPRAPWWGDKAWDTEVVFCQNKHTGRCE